MKKLLVTAAFAATAVMPSAAMAQALPTAVIAVVDVDRVRSTCNACKTAIAALQAQQTAEENREKALAAPLETEQKAIQAAANALNGKPADAALQARAKAFETKYAQAQEDAARGQQRLQLNQRYVIKQIDDKMNTIFGQVMQRRGANVMVEQNATLATASAIDVTNDVLTALNTALPSIVTVAPAQAPPQGR